MYDYLITIYGVDGTDAMYEVRAPNCHRARRIAVDWWKQDTNDQPIFNITTE